MTLTRSAMAFDFASEFTVVSSLTEITKAEMVKKATFNAVLQIATYKYNNSSTHTFISIT